MNYRFSILLVPGLAIALTIAGCGGSDVEAQNSYEAQVRSLGGKARLQLDFSSSDITDEDLKNLDFPETLVEINLSNTSITDEGVAELKRAGKLEVVVLAHTKITSKSIEHLKELPNLNQANIASGNITREELLELVKYLNAKLPPDKQVDAYQIGVHGPPPGGPAPEEMKMPPR